MIDIKYFYCEKCSYSMVSSTKKGRPLRYCQDCMNEYLELMMEVSYGTPHDEPRESSR